MQVVSHVFVVKSRHGETEPVTVVNAFSVETNELRNVLPVQNGFLIVHEQVPTI